MLFTNHETRNTAFFRNTVFPWLVWCLLVLKPFSLFFGLNLLWVESDDAVAGNENPVRARRGRAVWRRQSRPSHGFSGIYETRDPSRGFSWREAQAGANSEVFTKHETRDTKHGFFHARNTALPWPVWCSLVLKPFSLFFPHRLA